jgi:phosphopantothenoylcysteine decarboxylase/phosphopantothenate--cysteine ligase
MHAGLLQDKNILVAVTGSIAVYKTLQLIRWYIKANANVKVIMTPSAQEFVTALTFETISQNKVLTKQTESWEKQSFYNHIAIGKWADILVIAPASVNTINKLSHGIADNLLTQTAIAFTKTKLLCPAANTNMLQNPITQESLKILQNSGYEIVEPISKELACRDIGNGAMSEVEDIFYASAKALLKQPYWENRSVIISGGGSVEKLDEVRYLGNFSSGKMAASLALAAYLLGACVKLIASRGYETLPKAISVIKAQSSEEMFMHLQNSLQHAKKESKKRAFLFKAAAISDYVPKQVQEGKLKKELLGRNWNVELIENMDILSALDKKGVISIGFKAEVDEQTAQNSALAMLEKKDLQGVCLNILNQNNPFGSNSNTIELFLKHHSKSFCFEGNKFVISLQLLETMQKEFDEQ